MEYWTVMLITILGGDLDGAQTGLPFTSMAECEAATTQISATLSYDHNLGCVQTDTPSGSIRPERNPRYGE